MLTLLLLLSTSGPARADEPAPSTRLEAPALDPLDEGWRRLRRGDHDGATLIAASVLRGDATRGADARYLLGAAAEAGRRPDDAAAAYRAVIDGFPGTERARDARFRLALVLADGGRADEARRALKPLRRGAEGADVDRLALVDAELAVAAGRRGADRLARRRLDAVDDDALPWFEARVRLALLRAHVAEAAAHPLDGDGRRLKAHLDARLDALRRAEAEGPPLVALGEPRFVVAGLLEVGRGLEELALAMLTAPVPPELTPAQRDLYVAALKKQVAPLHLKAWQAYDLGVETATRLGFTGPEADALREALGRVTARVDAG